MKKQNQSRVPGVPAAILLLFSFFSTACIAQQKIPGIPKVTKQQDVPNITSSIVNRDRLFSANPVELIPSSGKLLSNQNISTATTTLTPLSFTCGDIPVGLKDNYSVEKDKMLTIAAPGLMANDFDPEGDVFNVSNYIPPSNGTLTSILTNGSFIYVPDAGFTGTDQFTYTLQDANNNFSQPVTVSIHVQENFDRKPIGVNDYYATGKETTLVIAAPGLMTNDTDPDGDDFLVSNFTQTTNGTITSILTNGSFSYVPDAGFVGTDQFTYTLQDVNGNYSDPVTIHITVFESFNRKPVGITDEYGTPAETPLVIAAPGLAANDFDPDGDDFLVSNFTQTTNGTITSILTNGSFTYVPDAGFTGTDQFSYTLLDANGNYSDPVTVTINVLNTGNLPIGSEDQYITEAGKTLTISAPGLLANDFDPDGDVIIVSNYTQATNGTITSILTNGSFSYVPDAGFVGTDQFTYTLLDVNGNYSEPVTVHITVFESFNKKPVGITDEYGTPAETPLVIAAPGLAANDFDPDGDDFLVSNFTQTTNGTITSILTNGSFSYVPDAGFVGTDQFTYTLQDVNGNYSDPVTIHITVFESFNRKPVGITDEYGTPAETPLVIAAPGLAANDFDPDGDDFLVSNFTQTTNGTITSIVTSGSFTYVPNPGFTGTDQFSYTLLDANGNYSDPVTVTITVIEINEPPVASATNPTVECSSPTGTMVTLDGSGSTDPERGTLTYTWYVNNNIIVGPSSSSTANVNFTSGTHQVTLKVEDECGASSETNITVTVQDTEPPVVEAKFLPTAKKHEYSISCSTSDVCSPIVSTRSLILIPNLINPAISLKNKDGYSLEIDESKNTVSVEAPDAATFWAMVISNGGILVNGGQLIGAKYDKKKYKYSFDNNGNLLSVSGDVLSLRCSATDGNGNTGVGETSLPMNEEMIVSRAAPTQTSEHSSFESRNYPNPFTEKTNIQFHLSEKAFVQINILDVSGRVVDKISSKQMEAGEHLFIWDAKGRAGGVYFYQIRYNDKQVIKKMILVR